MADEFYAKYEGVSHEKLYNDLKAGDPGQIDGLAAKWSAMTSTLADLARALDTDLGKLSGSWDSTGGAEFKQRLSLVSGHAQTLSEEYQRFGTGLTEQAAVLRSAQAKAEDPAETDDNDKAISGAFKGGLVGGAPGALIGSIYGRQQDKAEQDKAHNRMIELVAGLAASYQTAEGSTWAPPLKPVDPGLPRSINDDGYKATSVGTSAAVSSAGSTGLGGLKSERTIATPTHASTGPDIGTGGGGDHATTSPTLGVGDEPPGTGLAGAGGGGGTTGPGTSPGLITAGGGSSLTGGSGNGWLAAGGGLALAAGLVGGAALLTNGSSGAGVQGANPPGGRSMSAGGSGGGRGGETARASSSGGHGAGNGPGAGRGTAGDLGVRDGLHGKGGQAAGNAAGRGAGRGDEDEADERTTWLTEDEMVWGGSNAAPPVLGG
ncbi:WXG100 family type VII secretion target [Actinoplanes palleronii]|uniref:WXG100 family type VII secretion target n=1 Tax=Actinoplanes palleronii TaxID=113570 RepID=A0ABQ4B104_9ACTN|nr:hypothetical protein [Actinoplanes palleronii]GIE64350.1 hypothetical protein Apa02nite_004580 [Actinoplanes palleronii]